MVDVIKGQLTVTVGEIRRGGGSENNAAEQHPYVKITCGNTVYKTEGVKQGGSLNATFNETFRFNGARTSESIIAAVLDKSSSSSGGGGEAVIGATRAAASVWGHIDPVERWFSLSTPKGKSAGEIRLAIAFEPESGDQQCQEGGTAPAAPAANNNRRARNVRVLREPFVAIRNFSRKTAELTARLDPVVGPMIDNGGMFWAILKRMAGRTSTQQRMAAGGFFAMFVAMVTIAALVLFPVTIISMVVGGISLACFSPLLLALAWIALSANPVRTRIVAPAFERLLAAHWARTVFLRAP